MNLFYKRRNKESKIKNGEIKERKSEHGRREDDGTGWVRTQALHIGDVSLWFQTCLKPTLDSHVTGANHLWNKLVKIIFFILIAERILIYSL